MKRIVNIVIYYANEDEVFVYAKNLSKQTEARNISLVVVVNKEGSIGLNSFENKLSEIDLDILVFNPNKNLGYMNGLIYGYNQYIEATKDIPNWVVMSNTDIEFSDDSFFGNFLGTAFEEDVWCVAPSVYSPATNSHDNPQYTVRYSIKDLNRRIFIFEKPLVAYLYIKLSAIKSKFFKKKKKDSRFVYSAHGCFFIIRNELAEILKHKKYKALMYSEEAYIAENIRGNGKRCYYDSMIEIIHNESSVTSKLDINIKSKYIADSLKVIRGEFFS